MTPYEKLKAYHAANVYKRGCYVGDSPCGDRRKAYFRILPPENGQISIRMHRTNIITITEAGGITLRSDGWHNAPTTRGAFYDGLRRAGVYGYLTTTSKHGVKRTLLVVNGCSHIFYDSMEVDAEGKLLSPPEPVKAKRINKERAKAFMDAVKASGFKAMFPVLYAASTGAEQLPTIPRLPYGMDAKNIITSAELAEHWPTVIRMFAYSNHHYGASGWGHYLKGNKDCWAALMADCKRDMHEVVNL